MQRPAERLLAVGWCVQVEVNACTTSVLVTFNSDPRADAWVDEGGIGAALRVWGFRGEVDASAAACDVSTSFLVPPPAPAQPSVPSSPPSPLDLSSGCSATDLAYYTSPYTASTVSASNIFNPSCGAGSAGAKDMVFTYLVPPGATIQFAQSYNDYDSVHELRYGGACPGSNYVTCVDDPDLTAVSWTNTGSSAQPVYYVQSGFSTDEGSFTLTWEVTVEGAWSPPLNSVYQRRM
jgi:hypothetical protein